MRWYKWKPYEPVALRRMRALKKMRALQKKGLVVQPVKIEGLKIARTFWGKAWCDHLEAFSDYDLALVTTAHAVVDHEALAASVPVVIDTRAALRGSDAKNVVTA